MQERRNIMLNEPLYRKLKSLYPEVEIQQENIPAAIEPTSGMTLKQWQFRRNEASGEQYRINCPFCKDTKKHLYISYLSFASVTLNGEAMGKSGLIASCFRRQCLRAPGAKEQLTEILAGTAEAPVTAVQDNSAYVPDYGTTSDATIEGIRTWYPEYKPISECDDPDVLQYLVQERGISMATAMKFNIGYGPAKSLRTGKYYAGGAPFIMLPVIEPAGLTGVQLRALPKYQGSMPKYLFHPNCRRNMMLYNGKQASNYKVAVITEGAFDALKTGPMAVSVFGHTPSKLQLSRLETNFRDGGIIWLPDTEIKRSDTGKVELDPPAIARKQCAAWYKDSVFPWGAHVVMLPGKDAGEMSTADIWLTIVRQIKHTVVLDYIQEHIIPKLMEGA